MKKKLFYTFIVFIVLILSLTQFGVDVAGVRIGKQLDLKTPQKTEFNQSNFYSDYYSKDKLSVLNLWATWCMPCVEEMPELNKIKAKYDNQNIEFISMSVDTDSVKFVNFLSKKRFDFKDITLDNLSYRNTILNSLENRKPDNWIKSSVVPITYFIKNKKVLAKIVGEIDKNEIINLIEKHK